MQKFSKLAVLAVSSVIVVSLFIYAKMDRYDAETRAEMAAWSKKWDETHFCMEVHQKWPTFWKNRKKNGGKNE